MIHIFDVDNTLIRKTSMLYFLREALRGKVIHFSQVKRLPFEWILYKLGHPNIDFIEHTVKKLKGIKKSELERIAALAFEKQIKKNIYSGTYHLIKDALEKGERVIFATSSIEVVIKPLELFMGIENSLATKLEYSDGITTGRLVGFSFFGDKKRMAVENWMKDNNFDFSQVCFYTDSYTDIPLLEICGFPIAINPDLNLRRISKKRGWKILNFKIFLNSDKF